MTTLRLPGLVDIHTHMRQPGQTHKEDWSTGTAAALAGGFTTVLAMPNTLPPVFDEATLASALAAARKGARCDYGQYVGAGDANAAEAASLADRAAGLKMYLDSTFGEFRLPDADSWWRHLESWPHDRPIALHAEGGTLSAVLLMATMLERAVHVCHLATEEEMISVLRARERGTPVTCEVAPHHLFLDQSDAEHLGRLGEVRPRLAAPSDRKALWRHLDEIDCIATDHAPHTLEEKRSAEPPPGFPGLETALPLLIGAVHDGLLTIEDVVLRLHDNPRRIFGLPAQDAVVEIDPDAEWTVDGAAQQTRAGWSPFEGRTMRGRVIRVELRGEEAFRGGEVVAAPGSGQNVREEQ